MLPREEVKILLFLRLFSYNWVVFLAILQNSACLIPAVQLLTATKQELNTEIAQLHIVALIPEKKKVC
jgi:hypothetical protein